MDQISPALHFTPTAISSRQALPLARSSCSTSKPSTTCIISPRRSQHLYKRSRSQRTAHGSPQPTRDKRVSPSGICARPQRSRRWTLAHQSATLRGTTLGNFWPLADLGAWLFSTMRRAQSRGPNFCGRRRMLWMSSGGVMHRAWLLFRGMGQWWSCQADEDLCIWQNNRDWEIFDMRQHCVLSISVCL